jgi:hypothetical protein
MTAAAEPTHRSHNSDLATQVAKLWPHREREANIILHTDPAYRRAGGTYL